MDEPAQYANTWGELWQHIKADRARQVRALVLLLAIFVGGPLEVWGFLLLPLVAKIVAVLAVMPAGVWAWRGLRHDLVTSDPAVRAGHGARGVVDAGTSLGPCTACGTPYDECPISDDAAEWDTDANGNHDGLCCEDCQHLAQRR